jgi:hypothetical protein
MFKYIKIEMSKVIKWDEIITKESWSNFIKDSRIEIN